MHIAALMPMLSPGICMPQKQPTTGELLIAQEMITKNVEQAMAAFGNIIKAEIERDPWLLVDPLGLFKLQRIMLGIEPWPWR